MTTKPTNICARCDTQINDSTCYQQIIDFAPDGPAVLHFHMPCWNNKTNVRCERCGDKMDVLHDRFFPHPPHDHCVGPKVAGMKPVSR